MRIDTRTQAIDMQQIDNRRFLYNPDTGVLVLGRLNNEPPERPDLTDGQTYEEIRELAPETLPEEKPSLMERLKADRPEHEARQAAPPLPERER